MHWNVDPEIFSVGFISIRYYSLMFMISFVAGIYMFNYFYKLEKKPLEDLDHLFMYVFVATIVGARLGHCLFYDPIYYLSNPIKILKVWEGGLASHGAAIAIPISVYLYSRKYKDQPFLWVIDRLVITVALAAFFIRMGNFFNSEIIGMQTQVPWAIIFDRVDNIPRHPTQIYEALAYLVTFFVLAFVYYRKKGIIENGFLLGLFLVFIFGFRFFVEFVKADQSAFEAGMILNMGQILSIPAVLIGLGLIVYSKRTGIQEAPPAPAKKKKS